MTLLGSLIEQGSKIGARIDVRKSSPLQSQQKNLRWLLKQASNTAFGQYYGFKEILKSPNLIESFQQNIPIHDYTKIHEEWWHLALDNIKDVTWRGKVDYFALSSGTTNAPSKFIPVTNAMFRANTRVAYKLFFSLPKFGISPNLFTRDIMMLGGSMNLEDKGGYLVGDLSGMNTQRLPFFFRRFYKPGKEIGKIVEWNERIDEIVKKAPEWDIGIITGIPSWVQLMIEKIIDFHEVKNIHEVWSNLQVFVHGGVHFEPYKKGFEKLLGKPLTYIDTYLASEGFVALQNRPNSQGMKLLLNNRIFFEFIPFDKNNFDSEGNLLPQARALHIGKVEEGKDYAILLNTCAGAWRYLLGDTIRFVDKAQNEIIITGRIKHFLSICGEHLSIDNMNQAIQAVEKDLNLTIREFTVCGVPSGNFFKHKWYISAEPMIDGQRLKNCLDRYLRQFNADYATEREAVLDMEVVPLPPEVFYAWQAAEGKIGGQFKFPRVMKREQFEKWETFVYNQLK